jgi:hypothetical protein
MNTFERSKQGIMGKSIDEEIGQCILRSLGIQHWFLVPDRQQIDVLHTYR